MDAERLVELLEQYGQQLPPQTALSTKKRQRLLRHLERITDREHADDRGRDKQPPPPSEQDGA